MWKQITKQDIKSVPVGTKVRINGEESVLAEHYNDLGDYGFDVEDELPCLLGTDTFGNFDWNDGFVVEIWEEQTSINSDWDWLGGLPPVGATVEVYEGSDVWPEREIVAHDGDVAIYRIRHGVYGAGGFEVFRPLNMERDAWVGSVHRLLGVEATEATVEWISKVYDAIISGELEIPDKSGGV